MRPSTPAVRIGLALLAWTLLAAACSAAAQTTTTSTPATVPPATTTTTTSPTTTTTTVSVEGVPTGLSRLVERTVAGEDVPGPPDLAAAVAEAAAGLTASAGTAGGARPSVELTGAVGTWGAARVAVVTGMVGEDEAVLGAIAEEGDDGWRWVAGSVGDGDVWPSLPAVYAVVGSDARPGEDPARSRADSIHLVGLPGDGSASLVGIPRDSWVPIAGAGTSKVNSALATGGPERMMATFEDLAGVDLAGYALTGFVGFQEMVGNVLGGFQMDVPTGFRDAASGADFAAGDRYFNGPDALAFARARKAFDAGDFVRQLNGGLVLTAALGAVKAAGPLRVPALLEGSEEWLLTDLAPADLLELSLAAADVDLMRVVNEVLPGTTATRGGASVVVLAPQASAILADLADARLEG